MLLFINIAQKTNNKIYYNQKLRNIKRLTSYYKRVNIRNQNITTIKIQYSIVYYKNMDNQPLTELEGIDVSSYQVVNLTKDKFQNIDLSQFDETNIHLLIHAVQFQQKIPSKQTIRRAVIKNKEKILKKVGVFVPKRVKSLKSKKQSANNRRRKPELLNQRSSVSNSNQYMISDGSQKKEDNCFKIRSPEQIVLKSARQRCLQQLEKWKEEMGLEKGEVKQAVKKPLPDYFKKKHQNKKRRLKERRELIFQNKAKLLELYGDDIQKKSWRMSRQDIKRVLGITQARNESENVVNLGQFMEMVDEKEEQ